MWIRDLNIVQKDLFPSIWTKFYPHEIKGIVFEFFNAMNQKNKSQKRGERGGDIDA